MRPALFAMALLIMGCWSRVREFGLTEPLPDSLSYVWTVRAWHAEEMWVPAGDSLDLVLLRSFCGHRGKHGVRGCNPREDSTVHPRWTLEDRSVAAVRPLPRGSWIFGPGSAGARLYGKTPGVTRLTVLLPQGAFADSIRVLPPFDRLRLEPRDSVFFVGDTIRFRIMGLDSAGRVVTWLPWPFSFGEQVGPRDSSGAIPIVFEGADHPTIPVRDFVVTLGSKADTLRFRFGARDAQGIPDIDTVVVNELPRVPTHEIMMPFSGVAVIRDAAHWATLWHRFEHYGYRDNLPVRTPLPAIDFQKEMLLAARLGPLSGCSNKHRWIRRVQDFRDSIVVHVGIDSNDFTPCMMVIQPVDVVRVPRTGKPVLFRGGLPGRPVPRPARWWDPPRWNRFDALADWEQVDWLLAFAKDPATSKADLIEVARRAKPEWTIYRVLLDREEVRSSPEALIALAGTFRQQHDEARMLLMTRFGPELARNEKTSIRALKLLVEELPDDSSYAETARWLIRNRRVLRNQELLSLMTRNTQHITEVHRQACGSYLARWPAWKPSEGGSWTARVVCDSLPPPPTRSQR